ncbi:MAG: glycoside hydrolase family 44 protein [Chloroflexota bacterium]
MTKKHFLTASLLIIMAGTLTACHTATASPAATLPDSSPTPSKTPERTPAPTATPVPPTVSPTALGVVHFTVDTGQERAPISPYIYGTNQDMAGDEAWTARRFGGNRTTGYNWENNASNAGSDWKHVNDDWLCQATGTSAADCNLPGGIVRHFHEQTLAMGADYSLITLQLAGYVSRDTDGEVLFKETAPSVRWVPVVYAKDTPFAFPPDQNDDAVYMDEEVAYLVSQFGAADTPTGVRGYSLDNEPGLWSSTHLYLHPKPATCAELVERSASLSQAVKNVDPAAEIFGPALYGAWAYITLQDAPDWGTIRHEQGYAWFLDYYLDRMHQASDVAGVRLLDVLDVHWYPEARGDGKRIVFGEAGGPAVQAARMQAPRTLWDPTYEEDSWLATWNGTFFPLLPRLQQAVDEYYPGTRLAITEWSYGGGDHVSGGIATADALGIFGKYGVYFASQWQVGEVTDYYSAAYRLYRNYDGQKSAFGSIHTFAGTDDIVNSSIYASLADENEAQGSLHLIVLNKNLDQPMQSEFVINSTMAYTHGEAWSFGPTTAKITPMPFPGGTIQANRFSYTIPASTAVHIILRPAP